MKRIVTLLAVCLVFPALSIAGENAEKPKLDDFSQKLSYAMGTDVGKYFKGLGDDINYEYLVKGLTDGFKGEELAMSQEDIIAIQQEFGRKLKEKQTAEMDVMKEQNKVEGAAFLEENKKKEGVVVTKSGLQYQFIVKGDGAIPKADDQVKVDYVGSLIDGTEFDSSIKRGEPAVFPVNQVIPGWTEALQLMPVGSKAKLVIPSELAYGEQGFMPKIEPNSVLVFEVDLHSIENGGADKEATEGDTASAEQEKE